MTADQTTESSVKRGRRGVGAGLALTVSSKAQRSLALRLLGGAVLVVCVSVNPILAAGSGEPRGAGSVLQPGTASETAADVPWIELKKGLRYQDLTVGDGNEARRGSLVTVHYTGRLPDGSIFDTSKTKNQTLVFRLGDGRVIQGWELGVPGMRAGGTRRLQIPAKLAYGRRGVPGRIPPDTDLDFEIELIAVSR
jgi:hypothetical protein